MKVVFTAPALADLDEILSYTSRYYPHSVVALEKRIQEVLSHIQQWPRSARILEERPSVRVIPLTRYLYRVFYRVTEDHLEILHIHHAARDLFKT